MIAGKRGQRRGILRRRPQMMRVLESTTKTARVSASAYDAFRAGWPLAAIGVCQIRIG